MPTKWARPSKGKVLTYNFPGKFGGFDKKNETAEVPPTPNSLCHDNLLFYEISYTFIVLKHIGAYRRHMACLKITCLNFHSNFPGANEFRALTNIPWNVVSHVSSYFNGRLAKLVLKTGHGWFKPSEDIIIYLCHQYECHFSKIGDPSFYPPKVECICQCLDNFNDHPFVHQLTTYVLSYIKRDPL